MNVDVFFLLEAFRWRQFPASELLVEIHHISGRFRTYLSHPKKTKFISVIKVTLLRTNIASSFESMIFMIFPTSRDRWVPCDRSLKGTWNWMKNPLVFSTFSAWDFLVLSSSVSLRNRRHNCIESPTPRGTRSLGERGNSMERCNLCGKNARWWHGR